MESHLLQRVPGRGGLETIGSLLHCRDIWIQTAPGVLSTVMDTHHLFQARVNRLAFAFTAVMGVPRGTFP